MEILLALTVGALYAAGLYLLLRRTLVKVLVGLALLTNAANLLIFTAAGITRGRAPIVPGGAEELEPGYADPLPQALILTAIVIGFGIQAFAMVLAYRAYRTAGSDDPDLLRTTEELDGLLPLAPDPRDFVAPLPPRGDGAVEVEAVKR